MNSDEMALQELSYALGRAIAGREVGILASHLAPGFTHRSAGGTAVTDAAAFLDGITSIPGDIVFVRIESVAIDVSGSAAMATGVQHAQVRVDGETIDDRRAFADLFVKIDGIWKLRAAADFPAPAVV